MWLLLVFKILRFINFWSILYKWWQETLIGHCYRCYCIEKWKHFWNTSTRPSGKSWNLGSNVLTNVYVWRCNVKYFLQRPGIDNRKPMQFDNCCGSITPLSLLYVSLVNSLQCSSNLTITNILYKTSFQFVLSVINWHIIVMDISHYSTLVIELSIDFFSFFVTFKTLGLVFWDILYHQYTWGVTPPSLSPGLELQ